MLEVLAPAGNEECAKTAIGNGADAIYLGYSAFSARQSAENFDADGLAEIITYAHFCGVKVYVAMNTLVKESETETFIKTLLSVWNTGADAIILQDVFLGKRIHESYPKIVLHLSTQAGVCNVSGAKMAKSYGFSRVILARETPLDEIRKIARVIETEAFVQGALCTCFSGQCYFSSFAGGNSGNRGRCKQPCRKLYTYDRKGREEKSYALSLSDLSVGEDIQKYIDGGVTSFKIEGRMRRKEYVGAAVRYYRMLLENVEGKEKALSDLKRTYNRGNYTKGLAFGQDKRFLSPAVQGHIGENVGVVKVINGKYFVESIFRPTRGDAFKVLRAGKEVGGAFFVKTEGRGFIIDSKTRLKNGDNVFITTDTKVNERVSSATKKGHVTLRLRFKENDYAVAVGKKVSLRSNNVFTTANKSALTREEVIACFSKTDGLPVEIEFEQVEIEGSIFAPKSLLNEFRREFYKALCASVQANGNERYEYKAWEYIQSKEDNKKTAVIASDFAGVKADIAVLKPKDYGTELTQSFVDGDFEKYLYYPAFCSAADETAMENAIKKYNLDGVYAENYGAIEFAKRLNVRVFAGTGLNIINPYSLETLLKEDCVVYYAPSKEATESELKGLIGEKAFVLSMGAIKIMDLCYCPFGKTCSVCDKKDVYHLTDENERVFAVRRYLSADGVCRFEVYNCADLIGNGIEGAGQLLDLTLTENKSLAIALKNDQEGQKSLYKNYTSGHYKRGVL